MSGKQTMHHGIDISMKKGERVGATAGGTVVFAGFGQKGSGYGGYGNVVVVRDGAGNLHQYAHLDSVGVKVGQKVGAGSVVGGAGTTGKSTGVHLDYTVKNAKGANVDPTPYITGKTSGNPSQNRTALAYKPAKPVALSYTNNKKIKSDAMKSPGYKQYLGHLKTAVSAGHIPKSWAIALTELVGRESSWNPGAKNPKSTAHGYGQFLNSTRSNYEKKLKMNYSNPVHQLVMMSQYVKDKYKTPENALAFWDKNRWY